MTTWCLLIAGLHLAAACEGPTEPPPPFEVTLRVLGVPSLTVASQDLSLQVECSATIELSATGRGRADWVRVRRIAFRDVDRLQATDSVTSDFAGFPMLDSDTISAAQPDTTVLRWFGTRPYSVEFTFWYLLRGRAAEDSVMQRLDCGAAISPGASPPEVSILEVRGSDPVIEKGDTVIVRYHVEGGGPLWRSDILLSGSFQNRQAVYEEQRLAGEREIRAVVPPDAALAAPIALAITLTDVGGRADTVSITTSLVVVDVTPPSLSQVVVTPGQYAVGSMIRVTTEAIDERGLAHLVWELGAPVSVRDSIPIGGPDNWLDLVVAPEWAGADATLRLWVRDHGNNYSAPWVSATNAFRFHPLLTAPTYASGELLNHYDVVYDAPRERLYAVDTERALMRAFSIASMSTIATVSLPAWPGAADLTLSGDSLLITQSLLRALSVIDLNTLAVIDTIALPPVDSIALAEASNPPLPTGVRVLANGKAIVKLHKKAEGGFNTVDVDLQTGVSRLRTESTGGGFSVERWWDRLGVTANRSHLFILDPGCARLYNSSSDSFSGCMPADPGLQATRISSDAASTRVMIAGHVFAADFTPVATFPYSVTHILPDGLHVLAAANESLFRIRISDGRILSRMTIPFDPTRLILLEDGHTLLLFLGADASFVAKLDIASML